jgi:hypothetical protein
MQPRSANGAGRRAQAIDHRGCLRRRMWPLAESAGSPCMWLGRRRSCGMAGMRCVRSSSPRTPRMGRAQIPGLGIAGQVRHDLRERHAAGFGAQRLRCARGLAQRRTAKDPHPLIRRQDHRRAVRDSLPREAITPASSGSRMSQPYSPPNSAMPEGSSSCRSRAQTTVRSRNSTKPASVSAAAATPALRGIDLRGHHHTWPGPGNRRRRLRDCPCAMSSNEKHEQPRPGQTQSWPPDQRRSNACP